MSENDYNQVDFDFDQSPEQMDFQTVAPGTYLCCVGEARPGLTRSGHTRWGLKYVVAEGPDIGRVAAWDGLTFSPKAAGRTRQVLAALGLPHAGRIQLSAADILGRRAFVTVERGTYVNPVSGATTKRNVVPYGGVHPADRATSAGGEPQSSVAETTAARRDPGAENGELPF